MSKKKKTISGELSCWVDGNTQRWVKLHLLTLMFNVCNTGLYIESLNEFPEHFELSKYQLSEFSRNSFLETLGFIVVFISAAIILGLANKKSYYTRIENYLYPIRKIRYEEYPLLWNPQKKNKSSKRLAKCAAFYKAFVASSSFAALCREQGMFVSGVVASTLFFAGNFYSQYAVLAEEKEGDSKLKAQYRPYIIHFLTLCYNVTNTILYFNAGDNFLRSVRLLQHRLIYGSEWWEYSLLIGLCVCSLSLAISTQRSYSREVFCVFEKPKPYRYDSKLLEVLFYYESKISAAYKVLITSISLISALHSAFADCLGHSTCLWVGGVMAAICCIGNWNAQYSELKPELSKSQWEDNELEPKITQPYCCGLLTKTVPASSLQFLL